MNADFEIFFNKFQDLSDKAVDWAIRGWKYRYESDERKICELKRKILMREAIRYLDLANKQLNG